MDVGMIGFGAMGSAMAGHIGMDLFGPDPDFAAVARALGWYAEGPLEHGKDLAPALARAIAQVEAGKPALIDTVTQHR